MLYMNNGYSVEYCSDAFIHLHLQLHLNNDILCQSTRSQNGGYRSVELFLLDASVFNKPQIEFFKKHDRVRFKSLDFTFCNDDLIRELFPGRKAVTSVSIEDIPYTVKIPFSDIVHFRELSRDARMQIERDADIELSKLMTEFNKVHPKTSCMMLSKHLFLSTMD